jgi:hypothetical protein
MKIEFNGRVVAGFLLGGICGVVATVAIAAGPIGRIQEQRDAARATVERQSAQVQQLQGAVAAFQQRLAAQQSPQPATLPQSQDPAVQVLNIVRPGLGTVAGALVGAVQKAQAAQAVKALADQQALANSCPPDSRLEPGPWQGLKCVAVEPQ